jgi:hypothetical protein
MRHSNDCHMEKLNQLASIKSSSVCKSIQRPGCRLDDLKLIVRLPVMGQIFFLLSMQAGSAANLTSSSWGNAAGSEANHSPTCRVEVNNASNYTSTPSYIFMLSCLIKTFPVICASSGECAKLPTYTVEACTA